MVSEWFACDKDGATYSLAVLLLSAVGVVCRGRSFCGICRAASSSCSSAIVCKEEERALGMLGEGLEKGRAL
jgi:hypothetical protein